MMLKRNDVVRFNYNGSMRIGRVDGVQTKAMNGSENMVTVQLSLDKDGPVPPNEKRFKQFEGAQMGYFRTL